MEITRRDGLAALMAASAIVGLPRGSRGEEAEIVIGNPNSLTGGFGESGQRGTWGLLIAADEINQKGGIKALGGAKLKVIPADTSGENPTQAASVTRRMIDQEKAIVLVGATASAMSLAAQVEAEKSQVPLITDSYADALVERGMKYTFKITVKGSAIWNFAFTAVAEMIKATKGELPKGVAIYMGSDAVSQGIAKTLPIEAQRLGIPVVSTVNFQGNLSDPTVILAPLRRDKPDIILFSGFFNDTVLVLKAMRGLDIKTPVISAGGTTLDSAGQALGQGAVGMFMPVFWNWDLKTAGNSELVAAFKKAHPDAHDPPNNEKIGLGYSAGKIIAAALEKAGSRDSNKIRDALLTTEFTNIVLPGGKAAFDEIGQNKHAIPIVGEWMNPDEIRTVWPKEYQVVSPML
jgi:branched-chain amino acid transport system substrate-binding protein